MRYLILMLMFFAGLQQGTAQTNERVQLTAALQESVCGGNAHAVSLTASGGTAPYQYTWSDGQAGATRSNLKGGTYTCTVSDAKGRTSKKTVVLKQLPQSLQLQAQQQKQGGSYTVSLQTSGGAAPYAYYWFGKGLQPTKSLETQRTLASGVYQVVVQDANGCSATVSITLAN